MATLARALRETAPTEAATRIGIALVSLVMAAGGSAQARGQRADAVAAAVAAGVGEHHRRTAAILQRCVWPRGVPALLHHSLSHPPSRRRLLRSVHSPASRRRVGALCQDYAKVCKGLADQDVLAAHEGAVQ